MSEIGPTGLCGLRAGIWCVYVVRDQYMQCEGGASLVRSRDTACLWSSQLEGNRLWEGEGVVGRWGRSGRGRGRRGAVR